MTSTTRALAAKYFGEGPDILALPCVSAIERTRTFVHGFAEPTTFLEYETMIFWRGHPLDCTFSIVYDEWRWREEFDAHVAMVERELMNNALILGPMGYSFSTDSTL